MTISLDWDYYLYDNAVFLRIGCNFIYFLELTTKNRQAVKLRIGLSVGVLIR
jgi:hypothetical protein